ncbi:MAG TPA: hypothetical protein VFW48_02275 [Solirubrobacterales bacterium]|nr:hypothetical protein [Solirubrobacterales bacterium]
MRAPAWKQITEISDITIGPVFGEETSAFWFYGRLSPPIEVPPFFAQEIAVSEHARIEIVLEHLGIWARPGARDCKQPGEANQLAQLVVGTWALCAGQALEWSLDGWIEATEAQLAGAIMGHRTRPGRDTSELSENSVVSQRVRRAAELAIRLRRNQPYRLALRDIHIAIGDDTDDSVFYAFRAVENSARGITGVSGNLEKGDWASFHEALGGDAQSGESLMKPLTDARTAVAHGDMDLSNPLTRERRIELIQLARSLVAKTLEADTDISTEAGIELFE